MAMRDSLEEINGRVEAVLAHYELMEQQEPDRFDGLRREDQHDSTLAELAEAGKMRVDIVLLAMSDIGAEREVLLSELKAKLEAEHRNAEQAEKEGRHGAVEGDGDTMDEAALLERLDTLEAMQRRLASVGESILDFQRRSQSLTLIESIQSESAAHKARIDELEAEATERTAELEGCSSRLEAASFEVGELKEELKQAKEKAQMAAKQAKDAKDQKAAAPAARPVAEPVDTKELESARAETAAMKAALLKCQRERDGLADELADARRAAHDVPPPVRSECDHVFSFVREPFAGGGGGAAAEASEEGGEGERAEGTAYASRMGALRSLVSSLASQLGDHAALTPRSASSFSGLLEQQLDLAQ